MTYKNGFEPKDARTVHSYDQDDDFDDFDDWSLESIPPRPRRQRKTGTQALVEFLNTTSPEEFQKTPPTHPPDSGSTKRRSTRFFLRRLQKNKSSSSSTSSTPSSTSGGSSLASLYQQQAVPHTIHRKNYIEIVTSHPPPRLPHYYDPVTHGGSGVGVGAGSPLQALSSTSKVSLNEPILPTRRESSLHAPSIRSLSIHKSPLYPTTTTTTTTTTTVAAKAGSTTINSSHFSSSGITTSTACTSPTTPVNLTATAMKSPPNVNCTVTKTDGSDDDDDNCIDNDNEKRKRMVDALVATCDGMDVIEAGLIQRLKQCQLYGIDKPMDVVAAQLTEEHIRALKVSSSISAAMDQQQQRQQQQNDTNKKKKRSRHAQVQTLPLSNDNVTPPPHSSTLDSTMATLLPPQQPSTNYSMEELQRQLNQERQERQRLESALEATSDHFEVLSGLAYKKLRELWEEKLRWENACVELNDKLLMAENSNNGNGNNDNINNMNDAWTEDYQQSDYIAG